MARTPENGLHIVQQDQDENRKLIQRQIIETMSGPASSIPDTTNLRLLRPPQEYMKHARTTEYDEFEGVKDEVKNAVLAWRKTHQTMEVNARKILGNALAGIDLTHTLKTAGELREIDEEGLLKIGEQHRRNSTRVGHRRGGGLNKDKSKLLKALFPSFPKEE